MFDIWDVKGSAIPYTLRLSKPAPRVRPADQSAAPESLPPHTPHTYHAVHTYAEMRDAEPSMVRPVARDWMSHPVITVTSDATLQDALALLQYHELRCLPVMAPGISSPVGILSDRELLDYLAVGQGKNPSRSSVARAMRTDVLCARPETTIHRIAHVMVREHLFAMPVVDPEQGLVGVLSRGDILRLVVELTAPNLPTL